MLQAREPQSETYPPVYKGLLVAVPISAVLWAAVLAVVL